MKFFVLATIAASASALSVLPRDSAAFGVVPRAGMPDVVGSIEPAHGRKKRAFGNAHAHFSKRAAVHVEVKRDDPDCTDDAKPTGQASSAGRATAVSKAAAKPTAQVGAGSSGGADDNGDDEDCDDDGSDAGDDGDDDNCDGDDDGSNDGSSSSVTPAPAAKPTTTTQAPAPKATSTSSTAAAKPTGNTGGGAGVGQVFQGTATWFTQNGNPGNCGNYNQDSTFLVALTTAEYGDGSHCGKTVVITRTDTGKSIKALVQDSCPSCASFGDLDLSTGAFDALADPNLGVFPMKWQFAGY